MRSLSNVSNVSTLVIINSFYFFSLLHFGHPLSDMTILPSFLFPPPRINNILLALNLFWVSSSLLSLFVNYIHLSDEHCNYWKHRGDKQGMYPNVQCFYLKHYSVRLIFVSKSWKNRLARFWLWWNLKCVYFETKSLKWKLILILTI